MGKCLSCKHALWDYVDFYNSTEKQWFVYGCSKEREAQTVENNDDEIVECDHYEEEQDELRRM